jgi:hypothetical protein
MGYNSTSDVYYELFVSESGVICMSIDGSEPARFGDAEAQAISEAIMKALYRKWAHNERK